MRRSGQNALGAVSDASDTAVIKCSDRGGIATFEFTANTSDDYIYTCADHTFCQQVSGVDVVCIDPPSGCPDGQIDVSAWPHAPIDCQPVATCPSGQIDVSAWPHAIKDCRPIAPKAGTGCTNAEAAAQGLDTHADYVWDASGTHCVETGHEGTPSNPATCAASGGTFNYVTKKCLRGEQTLNKEAAPSGNTGLIVGGLALAAGVLYLATRKK